MLKHVSFFNQPTTLFKIFEMFKIHLDLVLEEREQDTSTVFCRIHAPARTPKSPEGRLYSGLIISKSNDVGRLRGFPNLQFRF